MTKKQLEERIKVEVMDFMSKVHTYLPTDYGLRQAYRNGILKGIELGTEIVRQDAETSEIENFRRNARQHGYDGFCEAHLLPYHDECPECLKIRLLPNI